MRTRPLLAHLSLLSLLCLSTLGCVGLQPAASSAPPPGGGGDDASFERCRHHVKGKECGGFEGDALARCMDERLGVYRALSSTEQRHRYLRERSCPDNMILGQ